MVRPVEDVTELSMRVEGWGKATAQKTGRWFEIIDEGGGAFMQKRHDYDAKS